MENTPLDIVREYKKRFEALGCDGLKSIRNIMIGSSIFAIGGCLSLIAWLSTMGIIPLTLGSLFVIWYLNSLISKSREYYNALKAERNA